MSANPNEVGPYRILRPVARGGMAEVYEVEDVASGEHLALKVLRQTGGAMPRFNREYEAMIRLNHPNIVRVYAYGMIGENPWISMELIEGTPIQAYAKNWGRPGGEDRLLGVLRAAHDLALALDYVHRRGLVHRDLKSANVLVLPDGRVKLIDFGTAQVTDPVEDITREGEFIGTFAYASPEQLQNLPIDGRSDLYSLGVLLYRLATGRRPFETDDIGELARLHVRAEPPPPTQWVPELPPAFEALILRLLAKDPGERLQTGAEVAEELERVAGQPLMSSGALGVDAVDTLVGREEQMRTLWGFIDGQADRQGMEAGHQPGDMALIVGLHGSGRHQIVQWLERDTVERGWTAMTLFFRRGADDLDQVAHLAHQLVRSFGPNPPAVAAAAAETVRRVERSPYVPAAERLQALRSATAQLLLTRGQVDGFPVVLFVRGLQHASPIGFEALASLRDAVRELSARVLLVADLNEHADHPGSLVRQRLQDVQRIALPPLTVRQVALLVGAFLRRRPPPTAVARRIYEASGGLPAYVEDVTKRLVEGGRIRSHGHDLNRIDWAQRAEVVIPVPDDARDRLLDELATLPADRRRCLETLALCGGEGSASLLAVALGCTGPELGPALKELEHRGWISLNRRDNEPYARWRQLLAQDLVLAQLHPCRRRVLERRVVERVAAEPAFVAQIELLIDVGRDNDALTRARDWAAHQLVKHRPLTALEVLDRVWPVVEARADLDVQLDGELCLLMATALVSTRPLDPRLRKALDRATRLFPRLDRVYEAEVLYLNAQVDQLIGHYPKLRQTLDQTWRIIEGHSDVLAATVATMLGWSTQINGELEEAAAWYGRARRIAHAANEPAAKANADVGVASWQLSQGLLGEAERTVRAVLPILHDADDLRGLSMAIPILTDVLGLQGRFSEALRLVDLQLPVMRECEVPTFYVRLLLAAATTETLLGRLGRAQEHIDELHANLRLGEHQELRLRADLVWGRIQVASGLYEDASTKLREVEKSARACGLRVMAESAQAARAEALWALGQSKESVACFKRAQEALAETGDVPAMAWGCLAQARAVCEMVDPETVLAPVSQWMDSSQVVVGQIEREIARGRYQRARGLVGAAFDRAQRLIDRLAGTLTATDASALRLHPWTQHIRRARKGGR